MASYYTKRALEILREEGPVELSKRSTRFLLSYPLKLLDPRYHRRFRFHTWKNHLQNRIKYDAPPDPYKTIEIRPSKIEHRAGRNKTQNRKKHPIKTVKRRGLGRTKGGDWDISQNRSDVEEQDFTKSFVERFEEGKDWEETEIYETLLDIYQKIDFERYDNAEDYARSIFKKWDELYQDIKISGYKYNHEGNSTVGFQPITSHLEVLIIIGRNGEVLLYEGTKRFIIARILDIEIPAQVVCRHKKWQELRDEIYNNGLPEAHEDLRDHPDLQDILK